MGGGGGGKKQVGGGKSKIGKKKFHVIFEWPQMPILLVVCFNVLFLVENVCSSQGELKLELDRRYWLLSPHSVS